METTSRRASARVRTIAGAFRVTASERKGDVAIRTRGDEVTLTWGELQERVDALAAGLSGLGVRRGDTVALMIGNRPEFHICDLAVMMLGATAFSIYPTFPVEQIRYVVSDADASVLIVEQAYLDPVLAACAELPAVRHVIVVDGDAPPGTVALGDVQGADEVNVEACIAGIEPDDIVTLIYTSGTTGPPKGVMLSHRNLMAALAGIAEVLDLPPDGRVVSWLPSAHVAERAAHHYLPIVHGLQITDCANPRDILDYLPEVQPTWFFAVPRIWEKLKAGLEAMLAAQTEEQRAPVEQAIEASRLKLRLERSGEEVPAELAATVAKADREIFAGIRKRLGLDAAAGVNVGSAPITAEVIEFFHALGVPLAEMWGMTETCGSGTVNRPGQIRIGTVGTASPGAELKTAEDGELLVRSAMVMEGYRNNPEATAAAIDADGWLHTGDIAEIDQDGYVRIVDRKKEMIINAAGKNMSPANIESAIKTETPLIGHIVCIGDRRPYNTALIVLDADFAPAWAEARGIKDTSLEALAQDKRMLSALQEGVDAGNSHLARAEQIKKFSVLPGDWPAGGDELTPTMKLKRKPIAEKYAADIDAMYAR